MTKEQRPAEVQPACNCNFASQGHQTDCPESGLVPRPGRCPHGITGGSHCSVCAAQRRESPTPVPACRGGIFCEEQCPIHRATHKASPACELATRWLHRFGDEMSEHAYQELASILDAPPRPADCCYEAPAGIHSENCSTRADTDPWDVIARSFTLIENDKAGEASDLLEAAMDGKAAEAQGFYEGTKESYAEIERLAQRALDAEQGRDRAVAEELRLRSVVKEAESSGWRQGMAEAHDSAMGQEIGRLREERDAWRALCEAGPQHINVAIGALISFYRDDERRDITAWLKHQGDGLAKQGETDKADAYLMAAYQVGEGAKMIGPGASRLAAEARKGAKCTT